MLLNELGFDTSFLRELRVNYLSSIAQLLLPEWFGEGLDSHKAFTVKYKSDEDLDLSYHFDNAEITLNICLGRDFEEGSLYFGNMRTVSDPRCPVLIESIERKWYCCINHTISYMHVRERISNLSAAMNDFFIFACKVKELNVKACV